MSEHIAQTTSGKLRGFEKMDCVQFRGIPYAAPPVGDLRWKSPQRAESWDGVRDATEFGAICHQTVGALERLGGARRPVNPMDEDCLTLNIFTPALDDGRRPTMVWLHGGGFSTGSGRLPWYYGHNFVRDGVVVVTINYRLNAFGFLAFDELFGAEFADSGTLGIQDQVAALEWVRDNIASFGGDPGNVTIFGESAGGMSVGTLLATPSAAGLFHKAIPQSGASHSAHPPDIARRIAERFITHAGVQAGDKDALLAVPVGTMVEFVGTLGQTLVAENRELLGEDFKGFGMPFQPVAGGKVLPEVPIDAIRKGAGKGIGIPTLVGTTKEEWKLFTLMGRADGTRFRAPRPLRNLLEQAGRSADEFVAAYEGKVDSEGELLNAIETDRIFRIPAIRLAEAQIANETPAWVYRFDWPSPAFDGRMGACHALEIPFVFDNLSAPGVDAFTGGAAPQSIATNMHAAWVAFAKTGDPGWAPYDASTRTTMLFDSESGVVDDPDGDTRALWDGLL